MASQCTQEAVLRYLAERGGRVSNAELIDHFKPLLPSEPASKAAAKEAFKGFVDTVGFVKPENGVKYVFLKKKYRDALRPSPGGEADGESRGSGLTGAGQVSPTGPAVVNGVRRDPGSGQSASASASASARFGPDCVTASTSPIMRPASVEECAKKAANEDAKPELSFIPDTGVGTDRESGRSLFPHRVPGPVPKVIVVPENWSVSVMGNSPAASSQQGQGPTSTDSHEGGPQSLAETGLPHIAVTEAFPAHASLEGEKDHALKRGNASSSWVTCTDSAAEVPASELELDRIQGVDSSTDSPAPESLPEEEDGDLGAGKGVAPMISRRRASKGSQRSLLSSHPSEEGAEDGQVDAGGDGYTPRGSRRNFRELLINSSPQLRRSVVLKNPGSVSARQRDSVRSDSDSASLMSSTDEDGGSVTLDPLEHEWMMCSSDGHWESLHRLLSCEPNLIVKKDFVTGFTCLHWAAKQGKPELIALLVNFAKHHAVPLNINCRSSAGYTPLHLAAMHNHVEVVKLLVGAYDADVDARDYSGKKAWQYLGHSVAEDIREIVGAGGDLDAENVDNVAGRWRLSKVLPANLMPLKLLNVPEEDACDAGGPVRPKSVYRKTSISRIKPKLHKIKFKTQIIHTTSFKEMEEGDRPLKSPGKSRPKSTLFG